MNTQTERDAEFYDSVCKLRALYEHDLLSREEYENIRERLRDYYESDLIVS